MPLYVKTCDEVLGRRLIMAMSLFDSLNSLGLLPFSGVIRAVLFSKSRSIHWSL